MFGLIIRFIEHIQLAATSNNNNSFYNLLWHTRSLVSQCCLHQSSGNSFQQQMFPFLWVPKLSALFGHISFLWISTPPLLCQEVSLWTVTSCQSQSYILTDGQLSSLFWCQALVWGPWPDCYRSQIVVGVLWSTLAKVWLGL